MGTSSDSVEYMEDGERARGDRNGVPIGLHGVEGEVGGVEYPGTVAGAMTEGGGTGVDGRA